MMLVAQKGFAATTTRQIALEAGVNEVTLFRHHRSKTELFHQILEEIRRLYPPLLVLDDLSRSGPEEAIQEYTRLTLRRIREAPHLVRLLLYAMLEEVDALRRPLVEDRVRGYRDLLSERDYAHLGRCYVSGRLSPNFLDLDLPPSGGAFFYVVRVVPDDFGLGYGYSTIFEPRVAASGDCP